MISELSSTEKDEVLPYVLGVLRGRVGSNMKITNREFVRRMAERGVRTDGIGIRKVIHVIRTGFLLENVVGGSRGYYVAKDVAEMRRYMIQSLRPRFKSLMMVYLSMEIQLDKLEGRKGNVNVDDIMAGERGEV